MKLSGKTAVVTGGGQGIGRGIALRFASEGAKVVVAQRNWSQAEDTAREIRSRGVDALAVHADITNPHEVDVLVEKSLERFGRIDLLVNNAARTGRNGPFLEIDKTAWCEIMNANLTGVFLCSQAIARTMVARRLRGRIINIGSLDSFVAEREAAAYAASKGGVLMLTKAMAVDLAEYGILVNCVIPGSVLVERNAPYLDSEPTKSSLAKAIPLGHAGSAADIAAAALFFASDENAFVTGATLVVDGGYLAYARVE